MVKVRGLLQESVTTLIILASTTVLLSDSSTRLKQMYISIFFLITPNTAYTRVQKNPVFLKKSPAHGGFYGVLLGFLFITIRMTGERGSRVTYLSNIASSGIQVLQICSRALFYLFNESLRLGIHILRRGGGRFSGQEGPKLFLLSPSSLEALPPPKSPNLHEYRGLFWSLRLGQDS
jgi:hypothetical protein